MPALNPLVARIDAPPIVEAHGWARRYDGTHGPLLDLCQAVPGYAPHPQLLAHAANAASDPAHARYGLIDGDLPLREAYAAHVGVTPEQVVITAGCNQAFFATVMAIAQSGDSILLPTPWFWNHQQSCQMLGIEPRSLPCHAEHGFVPDPAEAEALIDDRTRAIVLITPNNPTGAVYPPPVIAAFLALCRRRNLFLVLDETYRDFLPAGQDRAHDLFDDPGWTDHLIGLYSFSKAYCVPGHRLGAVTAGVPVAGHLTKILDSLHICPHRGSQTAITWGIGALAEWRAGNRALINDRADAVRAAFQRLPDWQVESLGAYFAYVRHPFEDMPSAAVAERMGVKLGAVCLPGSAFGPGQERHVRIAFANTDQVGIHHLTDRLAQYG